MAGLVILSIMLGGGLFGYLYIVAPITEITGQQVARAIQIDSPSATSAPLPATPVTAGSPEPTEGPLAVDVNRTAEPALTRQSRFNVLLLGSDTDTKFDNGTFLTQSMIVVTVDPPSQTVGMLSIPRDFWVRIPGHGFGKIDTAYELGGVDLARRTVEQDFGIPIHYYAWVGLDGFIKVIDELGGVTIDVLHPIVDDQYPDDVSGADKYAYMRLYIPAGPQHLSGYEALQYVRSRHGDLVGDFGRSARQQQVLVTLKRRAESPGILLKIPAMISDLRDSVRTDLTVTDVVSYANFARQVQRSNIKQVVLAPPTYSDNATAADGQAIVNPNWTMVDTAVREMFALRSTPSGSGRADTSAQSNRAAASPPDDARLHTPVAAAAVPATADVTIEVQNGTSVSGLGLRVSAYLASNGYKTLAPVAADRLNYQQTIVHSYDQAARPAAAAIGRLLGANVVYDASRPRGGAPLVVVILGADAAKRF